MSEIIGSFYLKRNEMGNLTGEFTNNVRFTVMPEQADLKEAGAVAYEGRYLSTWLEAGIPRSAELVIDRLANAEYTDVKYRLVWKDLRLGPIYEAEALLAEGVLVGHYISLS